jgi:hypothetical protein
MVPVFEVCVRKLLEFWSRNIVKNSGSAILPIHADLQRTVSQCYICSALRLTTIVIIMS